MDQSSNFPVGVLYITASLIMWTNIKGHLHKWQRPNKRICCHYTTRDCTSHMHTRISLRHRIVCTVRGGIEVTK